MMNLMTSSAHCLEGIPGLWKRGGTPGRPWLPSQAEETEMKVWRGSFGEKLQDWNHEVER